MGFRMLKRPRSFKLRKLQFINVLNPFSGSKHASRAGSSASLPRASSFTTIQFSPQGWPTYCDAAALVLCIAWSMNLSELKCQLTSISALVCLSLIQLFFPLILALFRFALPTRVPGSRLSHPSLSMRVRGSQIKRTKLRLNARSHSSGLPLLCPSHLLMLTS
jgi:hypothetical protein